MKRILFGIIIMLILGIALSAQAIPTLQLGVPGGPGEGTYGNYAAGTDPTEADTAFTFGNTLLAAGAYQTNKNDIYHNIGAQYSLSGLNKFGNPIVVTGENWSDFGYNSVFDAYGAVLMATVPDGTLGSGSITVNGNSAFYTTSIFESGFVMPNPPSNHAPVQDQDYLFFSIGNFGKSTLIPDFADETTGNQYGEIKTLTLSISGYEWVHFDLIALLTEIDTKTKVGITYLVGTSSTDYKGNPGSHDVTWKEEDGGGPPQEVPEPATMILVGIGLLGVGLSGLRKSPR